MLEVPQAAAHATYNLDQRLFILELKWDYYIQYFSAILLMILYYEGASSNTYTRASLSTTETET